jgi:hypothetical protein
MSMNASAANILQAGLTIEPEEAVAIAQQLIATFRNGPCAEVVEPPFGPPTPERVVLCDDGSVVCRGCETTPAVSEIARLLEALLPPPPARMPGGLRYTVARALLDVDVAPFDSLDDLSETLARYERGPRPQIVIRLLQRFAASRGLITAAFAERRRPAPATELRRALREADARLYLQHRALQVETVSTVPAVAVADDASSAAPRPPRGRSVAAALAGVAAGALLTATGEFVHHTSSDGAATPIAPPPAVIEQTTPRVVERAPRAPSMMPAAASDIASKTVAVDEPSRADARRGSTRATTSEPATSARRPAAAPTVKRTHPTPRVYPEPSPRRSGRDSMLERLRLHWLREVFTKTDSERHAG